MRYGWRRDQFDTFKYSMVEERLEQVREIDGELAYGKMRRALEKASQQEGRQASQAELGRLGKWRGLGKWRAQGGRGLCKRRQGKAGAAVGRNAGGRSGTLAPAASFPSVVLS